MNSANNDYRVLVCGIPLSRFLLDAASYYEELLKENVKRLEGLSWIRSGPAKGTLYVENERNRATDFRKEIEESKQKGPGNGDLYYKPGLLSIDQIAWRKSIALLYLDHVRNQRSIFASIPGTSIYTVKDLDEWISERQKNIDDTFGDEKDTPTDPLLIQADKPCLAIYDRAGKRVRFRVFINENDDAVITE